MSALFKMRGHLKMPLAPLGTQSSLSRRVLPVVFFGLLGILALGIAGTQLLHPAQADNHIGTEPMMQTTNSGWDVTVLFDIGTRVGGPEGYRPPGILDGMGALADEDGNMVVLSNHELRPGYGEIYELNSGATLRGARVSRFVIDPETLAVKEAGLAYHTIIDRHGNPVTTAMATADATATDVDGAGTDYDLRRLCSAYLGRAGEYGLEDDIFFTGEETNGGQLFALDIANNTLYAVPAAGRAGYESVALIDSGDPNKIAILIGDDRQGAPLLLYVGDKDTSAGAGFLERNGLANGKVYVWRSDRGYGSPEDWNGTGATTTGQFRELRIYLPHLANATGYDASGYADQDIQDGFADRVRHFEFSRPEDLSTNPDDGNQVVFASTGRGSAYPSDDWGTTYIVDADAANLTANLEILYDGDDAGAGQFPGGSDFGMRSPDNLVWANDGFAYIQEDRSTGNFGKTSSREASIWQIDPDTSQLSRLTEMDRLAPLPVGAYDADPDDLGDWESSGVIDVSDFFSDATGTTLLFNVQGHSVKGDLYGGDAVNLGLAEGGQLLLLQQTR